VSHGPEKFAAVLCRKVAGFAAQSRPITVSRFVFAVLVVIAGATAVTSTWHDHPVIKKIRTGLRDILASPDEGQANLAERLKAKHLEPGQPVFIRLFKEESALELWMRNEAGWTLFQTYAICRWSGDLGPKLRTGDKQAPEGFYRVSRGQLNPNSREYRSFNIGFPNEYDRALGRTGSYLMVHGGCSSAGCYAMTDAKIDDIYRLVEAALADGQTAVDIHAFPFRMSAANMARHRASKWTAFWRDLKQGYDLFETNREVPLIAVRKGRYFAFATGRDVSLRSPQIITAWR
jgi:murein L,D-transpeptidase YafK